MEMNQKNFAQLQLQVEYYKELTAKQEIKIKQLRDVTNLLFDEIEPIVEQIENTPKALRFWHYLRLGAKIIEVVSNFISSAKGL